MADARIKHLRTNQTPAEELLWHQLRRKRVGGLRFRRQFPLQGYIVDFVCLPARLVVEVDGATHEQTEPEDAARTARLQQDGFVVLRFRNVEIATSLEGVVRTIEGALVQRGRRRPLPLSPSHKGRGDSN